MFSFLLDIVEVPEVRLLNLLPPRQLSYFKSHSGLTMAKAFQAMLERFGLTHKVLGLNADNATSNDKLTTFLSKMDNSFNEINRVRCFNHTLQLAAKTLIKPFNAGLTGKGNDDVGAEGDEDAEIDEDATSHDDGERDEEDEGGEQDGVDVDVDDVDDDEGDDEELSEIDAELLFEDTTCVRQAVTKVRDLYLCPLKFAHPHLI